MIPKFLPAIWTAIVPALGNHVWQSTLFAVIAGLLTLILRKNHARARYWLWMAASIKFLIPFSLLVNIGNHLARPHTSAGTTGRLYFAIAGVNQPFTQSTLHAISPAAPSLIPFANLTHLLPALLLVWLCGFVAVLFMWHARWTRISAALRESVPLREGREVTALRRLARSERMPKKIEILVSRASLEPGIFGIARPVLLWPERISERLEDAHLEAILAHELWHVRRRDNLASAIHMVVEAIFWFHPLVWWLGAQLVAERERACDEAVLESGSDRQVYAESILKICEFCVRSPLACVSGVTGADLKKRIVRIMTDRTIRKLDLSRKLMLATAGFAAVCTPIVFGLTGGTQARAAFPPQDTASAAPVLESVSIKPHQVVNPNTDSFAFGFLSPATFSAKGFTLHALIQEAYGVEDDQVTGGPDWVNSEKYDIEAKLDKPIWPQKPSLDQANLVNQRMLQPLLANQFHLTLHHEIRQLQVYALVVADTGPKLQESKPGDTYPNGIKNPNGRPTGAPMMMVHPGQLTGQGLPMKFLAGVLSGQMRRIVLDRTGLAGNYDFTLKWTPDENHPLIGMDGKPMPIPPDADLSAPSFLDAIQQQLGLKLELVGAPVDVLVIDHAEEPSHN